MLPGRRWQRHRCGASMARKPRAVSNGYDQKQLEGYLTEIDVADEKLAELRSAHMNKCKVPRADIAGVFEAAKEAGIPQRAFRTVVRNRRLERKIQDNTRALEADDAESYDAICAALGDFIDLPLGQAAADRARDTEKLDTLHS
jgi:hypothetical protein